MAAYERELARRRAAEWRASNLERARAHDRARYKRRWHTPTLKDVTPAVRTCSWPGCSQPPLPPALQGPKPKYCREHRELTTEVINVKHRAKVALEVCELEAHTVSVFQSLRTTEERRVLAHWLLDQPQTIFAHMLQQWRVDELIADYIDGELAP